MPDLTWKPVAYEVKQVYAPVYFAKGWRDNSYVLKNKFMTKDLSGFKCTANLRENGVIVASVEPVLENVSPQSQKEMNISIPYEYADDKEYHIDLNIYDASGNEVSSYQYQLKSATPFVINHDCGVNAPLSLQEHEYYYDITDEEEDEYDEDEDEDDDIPDDSNYVIKGEDFEYIFSKKTGNIIRMTKNGRNYLVNCGDLCLDRPRSGLDAFSWGFKDEFGFIQRENITNQTSVHAFTSLDLLTAIVDITHNFTTKTGETIPGGIRYRINADGIIYVSFYVNSVMYAKHLQRAGIELILPEGYDKLTYFAYGETENYCDRKSCAKLGVYESDVDSQHFAFAPPSENGGHEDARWIILRDNAGASLKIEGVRPFHFDAHNYTVAECKNAKHDHEIIKCKETVLHIDAAHSPIGSNMAWSTVMPKELALKGGYYTLDFKITLENC